MALKVPDHKKTSKNIFMVHSGVQNSFLC